MKNNAIKSPIDIRNFTFSGTGTTSAPNIVGTRWNPEDHDDQQRVGICTAISMTMRAQKHYGIKFSPEFQYLMQKLKVDKDFPIGWGEGSSIYSAIKIGKDIGFLPASEFKYKISRNQSYEKYIKELRAIPEKELEKMIEIASKYKIKAYATMTISRDVLANNIQETGALLQRYVIGNEWYREPIEPLRPPAEILSGHAVNATNMSGRSLRISNSWGQNWADKGTAYLLLSQYAPTESWAVWFEDEKLPEQIEKQIENRDKIIGQILDYLQKIIVLVGKLR